MANIKVNSQCIFRIYLRCVCSCLVPPLGDGGGGVGAGHQSAGILAMTPGAARVSVARHHLQYSTVQYSTVQYSTVQYSTVQYSTVHHSTAQFSTVQHSTVVHYWCCRCGLGAGRCSKTCASIQVTEHTACTCGCGSRGAEQCSTSDSHVWAPDTCTCSCRDFQVMFHPQSRENGRFYSLADSQCCTNLIHLSTWKPNC